jgi:hypothetical protein
MYSTVHTNIHVTDKETKKCADPWENGAILNAGGGGGPGLPGGEENGQLATDSGGGTLMHKVRIIMHFMCNNLSYP